MQLDPVLVTDGESFRVTGQCLEPLYQYEPGSTKPIPALATECTANDASTEWTCKLRQGVKFHDGTDFNADAVIFNFERWRFTTNPYHYASQVFEYYEAMWGGFDDASIITKVEKVDEYTVKFTLNAPLAPFIANLAMDMFAISSPAAIEKYGEEYGLPASGCVGTGPFIFKEWVEGDHITVLANDDYWGGRPSIDEIVFRVIPDDSARYLALKAGDIQGLEQATVEDLAAAAHESGHLRNSPSGADHLVRRLQLQDQRVPGRPGARGRCPCHQQGATGQELFRRVRSGGQDACCPLRFGATMMPLRTGPTIPTCQSSCWLTPGSPMV